MAWERRLYASDSCGDPAVHDEAIVSVVGAVGLFAFLSIWVLVAYAASACRAWQDSKVKRDMIGRGYTAREIIAVVRCKRPAKGEEELLPDVPPAKPIRQPSYA
jgi:hypothetical protein